MKKLLLIIFLSITIFICNAQNFPLETNAIHKDSSLISGWATNIEVYRGYINISDTTQTFTQGEITSNRAWFGEPENALGKANGQLVSFGDAGYAIVQFDSPISNQSGYDFAVFSNSMFSPPNQTEKAFVELAFIEVSSDGVNYERFPAISNMQYETQITSFQSVEWNQYHNFAGLYPLYYGVPFNLDDIPGDIVDKNNITHIKIIDAIGCINPDYASYDSQGNIVNFAWPTPFWQGGFDLDAVALLGTSNFITQKTNSKIEIFPNPVSNYLTIHNLIPESKIKIYDINGKMVKATKSSDSVLNVSCLDAGVYIIKIIENNSIKTGRFIKVD